MGSLPLQRGNGFRGILHSLGSCFLQSRRGGVGFGVRWSGILLKQSHETKVRSPLDGQGRKDGSTDGLFGRTSAEESNGRCVRLQRTRRNMRLCIRAAKNERGYTVGICEIQLLYYMCFTNPLGCCVFEHAVAQSGVITRRTDPRCPRSCRTQTDRDFFRVTQRIEGMRYPTQWTRRTYTT